MKTKTLAFFMIYSTLGFAQIDSNLYHLKQIVSYHLFDHQIPFVESAPQLGAWVDGRICDNQEFKNQHLLTIADSIISYTIEKDKKIASRRVKHYPIINSQAYSNWENNFLYYNYFFNPETNKLIRKTTPNPDSWYSYYYNEDSDLNYYCQTIPKKKYRWSIENQGNTEIHYIGKSSKIELVKIFDDFGRIIEMTLYKKKKPKKNYILHEFKWENDQLISYKFQRIKNGEVLSSIEEVEKGGLPPVKEIHFDLADDGLINSIAYKCYDEKKDKQSEIKWSSRINESGLWEINIEIFNKPYLRMVFDERANWIEKEIYQHKRNIVREIYYK